MKLLIVLEAIKIIAWAYIFTLIILKRKCIPVNKRWIGIISSALMVVAGIMEVSGYLSAEVKSIIWLAASAFTIAFYVTVINKCCNDNKPLDKSMFEFIEKIEQDKKTIADVVDKEEVK